MRADLVVSQGADASLPQEVVITRILDDQGVLPGLRTVVPQVRTMPHHPSTENIHGDIMYGYFWDRMIVTQQNRGLGPCHIIQSLKTIHGDIMFRYLWNSGWLYLRLGLCHIIRALKTYMETLCMDTSGTGWQ